MHETRQNNRMKDENRRAAAVNSVESLFTSGPAHLGAHFAVRSETARERVEGFAVYPITPLLFATKNATEENKR